MVNYILCEKLTRVQNSELESHVVNYLNIQAVKKGCGPQKGHGEKRCEIQGDSQEMAVMVG